ncbi:MAG: hypothetical protein ACXADB_00135 [Candidatus Hermodarchaeia archaeon]|jgi:hypothetical protein
MTSKKILRNLGKTKKSYKEFRTKLKTLESELDRIESQIRECREGVRSSRSQMLRMNKVLQNMDLADANYAVFYDNDAADVGYIVGGEEHYLDIDDEGEISLTLMKEKRKADRARRLEESEGEAVEDEDDEEDEDPEEDEDTEDEEEDEEEEEDEPVEEDEEPEEEDEDEEEEEEEDEEEEDEEEDDNESDDGFIAHPNLRFID